IECDNWFLYILDLGFVCTVVFPSEIIKKSPQSLSCPCTQEGQGSLVLNWQLYRSPERAAAVVPIAGRGQPSKRMVRVYRVFGREGSSVCFGWRSVSWLQ